MVTIHKVKCVRVLYTNILLDLYAVNLVKFARPLPNYDPFCHGEILKNYFQWIEKLTLVLLSIIWDQNFAIDSSYVKDLIFFLTKAQCYLNWLYFNSVYLKTVFFFNVSDFLNASCVIVFDQKSWNWQGVLVTLFTKKMCIHFTIRLV